MKRALVLCAAVLLSACGGNKETKAEHWCHELMTADVDMVGLRRIYTDAINDQVVLADLQDKCGTVVQLVIDNGGTLGG